DAPTAAIPLLGGRDAKRPLDQPAIPVRLFRVSRGQADGPLDLTDVAVADQIAQDGGQSLRNDGGHPDRVPHADRRRGRLQPPLIMGDETGQLLTVAPAGAPSVADHGLDIHAGLRSHSRQAQPAWRTPVETDFPLGPHVRAACDQDSVAHLHLIKAAPGLIWKQDSMGSGAFQLQSPPRADPHRFSVWEARPIIDPAPITSVGYADW